jgi:hypothetical protein
MGCAHFLMALRGRQLVMLHLRQQDSADLK